MRKYTVRILVFALLMSLAAVFVQAAEKHPFGAEDMAALRSAHPIAISADGETILYGASFGGPKGPTNREWHLVAVNGFEKSLAYFIKMTAKNKRFGFVKE